MRPAPARPTDLRQVIPLDRPGAPASRSVAEWVLARGGAAGSSHVQVRVAGQRDAVISNARLLPAGAFTLVGIKLDGTTTLVDADLGRLAGLGSLGWLDLSGTSVTALGLKQLTGVAALTRLNLEGTQITDEAVAHVARECPNLHCLLLGQTSCTPAVVTPISGLKQLRELSLAGVPIGGEHLAPLASLANLEYLNLARTKVTDEGLAHVLALKSLRTLEAGTGQFSPATLAALRAALPRCEVRLGDGRLGEESGTAAL